MLEYQKKKKINKILYSRFMLVVFIILFIFLAKGVWSIYSKEKLSAQNLEKEKLELAKLLDRQKNLAMSIEFLNTDQGIENEIRTKFRAVKDGEQVTVIIDDDTKKDVQKNTPNK